MFISYKNAPKIAYGLIACAMSYKLISYKSDIESLSAENLNYTKMKEAEASDSILGQYALNMMNNAGANLKLSEVKRQILARSIVKVTNDVYESVDHKKAFIAVIAIESGFQKHAQSPTGPKGLSQVAKAAFKEGLALCGIPDATEDDVWDAEINLYAGACYFRNLLEKNNNDPYIAIVAYNKGPNSESIKTYSKNGNLNDVEALKYIAKFNFLKRNTSEGKMPNVPSFEPSSNLEINNQNKKN